MSEAEPGLTEIYLRPGEMVLARDPVILATILGSCVGVTFWSLRLGIGALCHAILPRCPGTADRGSGVDLRFRYVDSSIRSLACQFDSLGVSRAEVEVKVFGGADVIFDGRAAARPSIGSMNSNAAMRVLSEEGYRVVATSVGDRYGRKIRFNTGSGEVQLIRLT